MFKKTLFAVVLFAIALFGYTKVMARISLSEPPLAAPSEQQADAIRVEKANRQMTLLRDGGQSAPIAYRSAATAMAVTNSAKAMKRRRKDTTSSTGATRAQWRI